MERQIEADITLFDKHKSYTHPVDSQVHSFMKKNDTQLENSQQTLNSPTITEKNQSVFHFQQPSFLKLFEDYLSGHFSSIQTNLTQVNSKFNHFDQITSDLNLKINFLQKELRASKLNQESLQKIFKQSQECQNVPQRQNIITQENHNKSSEQQKIVPTKQRNFDQVINQADYIRSGEIDKKMHSLQKRIEKLEFQSVQSIQLQNSQISQKHFNEVTQNQINSDISQIKPGTNSQDNLQSPKLNLQVTHLGNFQNIYELLNRKIYQLQKSFSNLEVKMKQEVQTVSKPIEAYAYEVQSLKNLLQESKFKRQAKYLKMMSKQSHQSDFTTFQLKKSASNHESQSYQNSVQQYLGYLSQKVQFLLSCNKEFLPKQVYQFQNQNVHQILQAIRKRLTEKVSYEDLSQIESIQDIKHFKKPLRYGNGQLILQKERPKKQEGIKPEKSQVISNESLIVGQKPQKNQKLDTSEEVKEISQSLQIKDNVLSQIQAKLDSHEDFLKNMNKFYNEKLNSIEISLQKFTLIQKQQNIQSPNKSNNFLSQNLIQSPQLQYGLKENYQDPIQYNLKNHLNHKQDPSSKQNAINPIISNAQKITNPQLVHSLSQGKKPDDLEPHEMHNFEFFSLKKKISKLNGKYEMVQVNIKNFRQEIMKYLNFVQKNDQNKTDWDSFKKAIKYFDEKIKELQKTVKAIVQIQNDQNASSHKQGLSSGASQIAAKKKWSCLLCDKEFKNYEGKTSEIRYLGVASGTLKHESPRAVSYMKQSLKQKEYEKIFMRSPGIDLPKQDSGRRKRSISKSKEYMKYLNQKISLFDQDQHEKHMGFNN